MLYLGAWVDDISCHGECVDTEWREVCLDEDRKVLVSHVENWDGEHWTEVSSDIFHISYIIHKLDRQQGTKEDSYLLGIHYEYGFVDGERRLAACSLLAEKVKDELASAPSKTWQDICYEKGCSERLVSWAFV